MDRAFYQAMIAVGVMILVYRRISWDRFVRSNKWLALYFAYFGISVLWSDYPFVAFKRWIKDFGNVIMVLIIVSDRAPGEATKAVLVRSAYVLIPFSFVVSKYLPEIGRGYDRWTGAQYVTGLTTSKNLLGMVVAALVVSVFWALLELRPMAFRNGRAGLASAGSPAGNNLFGMLFIATMLPVFRGLREFRTILFGRGRMPQTIVYLALLAMAGWLLVYAHSATAIMGSVVGVGVLLLLRFDGIRSHVRGLLVAGMGLGVLMLATGEWSLFQRLLINLLGRDPTLTGRTAIWDAVLGENTNPVFGVGFYSFWIGERVARLSAKYHYLLNEAHNGYLEVYLMGGFIGLGLLVAAIGSSARMCVRRISLGRQYGVDDFRLAIIVVAMLYCVSEAVVSRLDLVWFVLLLAVTVYRVSAEPRLRSRDGTGGPRTKRGIPIPSGPTWPSRTIDSVRGTGPSHAQVRKAPALLWIAVSIQPRATRRLVSIGSRLSRRTYGRGFAAESSVARRPV